MDQHLPFDEDRLLYLLQGHIRQSLTADEKKELEKFAGSSGEYQQLLTEVSDGSMRELLLKRQQAYNVDAALARVKNKTGRGTSHSINPRIYVVAAAAASLLFATFLIFFYSNYRDIKKPPLNANLHIRVLPGSNKATLTLANGQKINLDDSGNGTIAQQSGSVIQKASGGIIAYHATSNADTVTEYNTITIPRGGQYRLVLADGTKVWLNAASSLKYPSSFKGRQREVTLSGEGYFEVVHNAKQPFVVKTATQTIKDIGTSFNLNTYTDEPHSTTTLIDGAIQLTAGDKKVLLKPGQQAVNRLNSITISSADLRMATAWKDGQFRFRKTDIKNVLRQVSRWYNIDIVYQGIAPTITISGGISRQEELAAVLEILQLSEVRFIQEDHKLIILNQDH